MEISYGRMYVWRWKWRWWNFSLQNCYVENRWSQWSHSGHWLRVGSNQGLRWAINSKAIFKSWSEDCHWIWMNLNETQLIVQFKIQISDFKIKMIWLWSFAYIYIYIHIYICHVLMSKYIYKKLRHLFTKKLYFGFFQNI